MNDGVPAPDGMAGIPSGPLVKTGAIFDVGLRGNLGDYQPDPDEQRAGLHNPESVHYFHGVGKEARWIQDRLRDLLLFTNARWVTIAFLEGVVLDSSDLVTHQTIKDTYSW